MHAYTGTIGLQAGEQVRKQAPSEAVIAKDVDGEIWRN